MIKYRKELLNENQDCITTVDKDKMHSNDHKVIKELDDKSNYARN